MEKYKAMSSLVTDFVKPMTDYGITAVLGAVALLIMLACTLWCFGMVKGFFGEKKKNEEADKKKDDAILSSMEKISKSVESVVSNKDRMESIIQGSFLNLNERMSAIESKIETIEEKLNKHISEYRKEEDVGLPPRQLLKDRQIDKIIGDCLEKIVADRVDVFLFSNGTRSTNGKYDFMSFKLTHERQRVGCPRDLRKLEKFPFGSLVGFFEDLFEKKVVIIDTKSVPDNGVFDNWVQSTNARKIAFCLIESDGAVMGFSAAYFGEKTAKGSSETEIEKELRAVRNKIDIIESMEKVI